MTKVPDELRASRVRVGASSYVLVSFPRAWATANALTSAEQQVVLAVLSGLSNAQVAQLRGSAPRTVANQLATIFRKLGVRSRAELAARAMTPD